MKIGIRNFTWIFTCIASIITLIIIKALFSDTDKELQIRLLAILGTLVFLLSLRMIKSVRRRFDYYSILVFLTYIFMFGQHVLFLLGLNPLGMILLTNRVSKQALFDTGFLVLSSELIMNIGYLMHTDNSYYKGSGATSDLIDWDLAERQRKALYRTGVIFFVISIIPTIITLAENIYLTFTVGYGERMLNTAYRRSGITNIASILSEFMSPALFAVYIGRNKGQKWPVIAIVVYLGLYTLSGSRIRMMILLSGILYIQSVFFEKISLRTVLKYCVLGLIVVALFSIISVARQSIGGNSDFGSSIASSFESVMDNNPIISAVSEAGYTFEATATVVDNCPSKVAYNHGLSYISGLAYILPNGITNNYYNMVKSTDEVFKGFINAYGSGIGSSFVAEAYWNFGYFSLIVMFLFGWLIGKLCTKLDKAIYCHDYINIFVCTYVFSCISFYVRSDTRTFFRNFVWFCVPLILVYKSSMAKSRQRNAYERRTA